MADSLFLRFRDQEFEWLIFDSSGRKKTEGLGPASQLNESLEQPFEGRVVFVAPGEEVLLTTANIPSKQHRQIVQAVPYAIEERLAMDVEDCFFSLGSRNVNNEIQVAVVDRSIMRGWLDRLDVLEVDIGFMTSEANLLPSDTGISVLIDDDRVHIRWPNGAGMTTNRTSLPLALSAGLRDLPIQVSGSESDLGAARMQLSELEASGEAVSQREVNESGFHRLCCEFAGTENNLLQGEFKVNEEVSSAQRVWRSVAVLAVIAVVLHVATLVGQGWYFDRKSSEYEAEADALYASVFPKDRNVKDLRRRWNAHLGRSESGGNEFLSLFAASSRGLPGAGLTLHNVNFNESRGDLILQVIGKRSEELVEFTQQLTREGLDAEIGTINQDAGIVRGSIKIRSQRDGS
jgi:general secretion pathway protein L